MRITLTVTAGPHEGRTFDFERHDTFIVGRSKRAHFRLPQKDKYFSRFHFMVEVNPPHCRLMDMASRNGTHVNGHRVNRADLRDGDEIKAGRTILRVAVAVPTPAGSPEPVRDEDAPAPPPCDLRQPVRSPGAPLSALRVPAPSSATPLPTPDCPACGARQDALGTLNPTGRPPDSEALLCPSCLAESEKAPQLVPGYQIVRELGRGNVGIVYLGVRKADGAAVALKMFKPTAGTKADVERFLREANILRALDHPNIVAFRDTGEANGRVYLAMDYVRGTDAARLLKAGGPLPVGRAVDVVCQLLEALEYAHGKRFVHRDIKPANVLLAELGGREVAKLTDFGLARVYQDSKISGLTMTGDCGGTPAFMPPEHITNYRDVNPAADQYGTAATLYNLLTGRYLFDPIPDLNKFLLMILRKKPVPIRSRRREVPKKLAEVIHKALAKEPAGRFANAGAMRQALLPFRS